MWQKRTGHLRKREREGGGGDGRGREEGGDRPAGRGRGRGRREETGREEGKIAEMREEARVSQLNPKTLVDEIICSSAKDKNFVG
ncbi:hypothetical protein ACLB2K_037914 [Fragaria x ananassa]